MMRLRDHPKLRHAWPPAWASYFSGADKFPIGEDPDKLLSAEESDPPGTISLRVEFEGRELLGVMVVEDPEFRSQLVELLQQNIGKSIREIGCLDLPFR